MLKRILFAVIPMVLAVGTVSADDNLLSKLADMNDDAAVQVSMDESDFGKADIDALMGNDEESDDDAIAACFRRIGYGYSYRPVYYGYNYCYGYNYYRPVYYTTYRYVYRPVYTCYTPIYTSYWGCY